MRNTLFIVLLSSVFLACNPTNHYQTLEGDLSFTLIEVGSYYALADGLEDKIYDFIDSLNNLPSSTLSDDEQEFLNTVNLLEINQLLFLPSFRLKTDQGDYRIYLDSLEYESISKHKREDLIRENKKVRIRLEGQLLATEKEAVFPVFRCYKILSTEKIPGKTGWRK